MVCPTCQNETAANDDICPECGTLFAPAGDTVSPEPAAPEDPATARAGDSARAAQIREAPAPEPVAAQMTASDQAIAPQVADRRRMVDAPGERGTDAAARQIAGANEGVAWRPQAPVPSPSSSSSGMGSGTAGWVAALGGLLLVSLGLSGHPGSAMEAIACISGLVLITSLVVILEHRTQAAQRAVQQETREYQARNRVAGAGEAGADAASRPPVPRAIAERDTEDREWRRSHPLTLRAAGIAVEEPEGRSIDELRLFESLPSRVRQLWVVAVFENNLYALEPHTASLGIAIYDNKGRILAEPTFPALQWPPNTQKGRVARPLSSSAGLTGSFRYQVFVNGKIVLEKTFTVGR